jgi:hypothetical protein
MPTTPIYTNMICTTIHALDKLHNLSGIGLAPPEWRPIEQQSVTVDSITMLVSCVAELSATNIAFGQSKH